MSVRPTCLVLALSIAIAACAPRPRRRPPDAVTGSPIDTLALRAHTFFLASDLLRGRATGSAGAAAAALYLESACRRLGLLPVSGSYAHAVPLEVATVDPDHSRLHVSAPAEAAFTIGTDVVFSSGSRTTMRAFGGPTVWVGSGGEITASPETTLPPLDGAVAVTAGPIRLDAARVLADRGAVGIIHLIDDAETFRLYAASRSGQLMAIADTTVPSSFFPALPSVIAGPAATRALIPAVRRRRRVRVEVAANRLPIASDNVACLLPGTDPGMRDTAIALTAHYDHLGVSLPDADGDSIYNGFSDNAVGVAMILSIAEAAARLPRGGFRHALLLLFFTGEERGLLGSDYLVTHPPYPLDRIRAVVNLDAGAPPARPWNWRVAGGDSIPLGALAMDVAASRGWSATTSPATPNSDYFPFGRRGVPAVFLIPGAAPYEGLSVDSSAALRQRWDHYHQPADEWDDAFPFAGVQRYAEYAYMLVTAVDRTPERVRR